MKIFLDTSSLFKLYYQEDGTNTIDEIFLDYEVEEIFLSEITKIEFCSATWKKIRAKEISEIMANEIIQAFESDFNKYIFIPVDNLIVSQAQNLIIKYGRLGLRTLDSVQLSTAVSLKNHADLFITSDKLLDSFFKQESLPIEKTRNNI